MRFFKRAHAVRLEVRVHDSTVYLGSPDSHSSRSNDSSSSSSSLSSSSTPSASLRGFVRFELDSPRTFDSLQVHFVGNLSIQSGATRKHGKAAPAQEHEVLRHEVDLLYDHSPYFEAGSHSLEFAILIPSTISPTIQHASGKLQYLLSASVEDSNGDQSCSRSKEVQLVSTGASAAISTSNEEALVDIVSYNYAVGPFSARLVSDQPTVGSLLYLHLHLPSPREGVVLYQISVSAIQKTVISSRQYGTREQITERHLLRLFNLPHNKGFSDIPPLFEEVQQIRPWKAGDEVTLEHMLRLPSHDVFSPSTPRHLRRDKSAPISLTTSHSICLKLRYGTPEREVKELQISRDFTLLSCKCVADTVVAPAYSVKDPRATKRQGLLPNLNISGSNIGPSVSQYGHTPAGQGCACVREGNAEQITSLWKERFAAPPDLQVDQKLARA